MLGVREWGTDSVLLSGGYLFNSDGESTKASDFLYSKFYNGAALSTSGGKAAFINTKFEIISEIFETDNQSMTAEYIGNGQFCVGGSAGYFLLTPSSDISQGFLIKWRRRNVPLQTVGKVPL